MMYCVSFDFLHIPKLKCKNVKIKKGYISIFYFYILN